MALSLAAGLTLSPKDLLAAGGGIYPPARTGLRGAHTGSFEAAHKIAWEGWRPERPSSAKDGPYDLVIVGGGLSGLAAAFTYQQRVGKDARILILDNHDDFGGHAKRNEFNVLGRRLIGYGGSQSIDGPAGYSKEAQALLRAIGVETQRFYDAYDQGFYARHGLGYGMFFDAEHYGVNRMTPNPWRWDGGMDNGGLEAALTQMPITQQTRAALGDLFVGETPVLTDQPLSQRITYLQKTSYENLLRDVFHCPEEVVLLLRNTVKTFWGLGWDALSALEAARLAMPGTQRLGIEGHIPDAYDREEPYIFHFPDGNAGLARLLVAHLIPSVSAARTMDTCVLDKPDYARLDARENKVRIRLNATAADVRHKNGGVDVTYIRDGRAERVEAKAVIMACWHNIIPYICPELPENQVQAMGYGTKVPLLYVNVALRNWRAFADVGYHHIYSPQAPFPDTALDFPVSMGAMNFPRGLMSRS